MLVEQIHQLALLGRRRVVDVVRDQDGAQARHRERSGVKVLLEIRLFVHDGGAGRGGLMV